MKKSIFNFVLSVMLAAAISGCSIFVPHFQTVTVTGEPEDAKVTINGNSVCIPGSLVLRRDKPIFLSVVKAGYQPYTSSCGYSLSGWGVTDLIFGVILLVPLFGLMSPGAYKLDMDHFDFTLRPNGVK